MPIYEYDCQQCGTFEVSQKMSDPVLTEHADCGSPVNRRISLSSFALKGGGWHADGYASTKGGASESPPCATGGGCPGGGCALN